MRAFWAIVGTLMLALAGYLLVGSERAPDGPAPLQGRQRPATAAPPQPAAPELDAMYTGAAPALPRSVPRETPIVEHMEPVAPPLPAASDPPAENLDDPPARQPAVKDDGPNANARDAEHASTREASDAESRPVAGDPAGTTASAELKSAEPANPAEAATEPTEPPVSAGGSTEQPDPAVPPEPAPASAPPPASGAPAPDPASVDLPQSPEASKPPAEDAWLVVREDGSMIADSRYIIRGKGTAEEPYKVSWEHLISAEEEYVPRDGRTQIPKRVQMLHDKHVEITGYVAFPLLMDAADELLVMLNQWDGCCLGVPPTPYDAVEVQLRDMVTGNARMTSYGTITGLFKVEPHLVGGWLVGLYLMEDARLKPLAFGGFAP